MTPPPLLRTPPTPQTRRRGKKRKLMRIYWDQYWCREQNVIYQMHSFPVHACLSHLSDDDCRAWVYLLRYKTLYFGPLHEHLLSIQSSFFRHRLSFMGRPRCFENIVRLVTTCSHKIDNICIITLLSYQCEMNSYSNCLMLIVTYEWHTYSCFWHLLWCMCCFSSCFLSIRSWKYSASVFLCDCKVDLLSVQ